MCQDGGRSRFRSVRKSGPQTGRESPALAPVRNQRRARLANKGVKVLGSDTQIALAGNRVASVHGLRLVPRQLRSRQVDCESRIIS